jgi:cobyrinic acid a,c-diamide synthase
MYLAQTLELDGETYPLCGVLPFSTKMPAPLSLAYVEVTTNGGLFGSGQTARGHLFHHSAIAGDPATDRCYKIKNSRGEETQEGYLVNNVLATYAHLHLASNPALADAFIDQCASFRTRLDNGAPRADALADHSRRGDHAEVVGYVGKLTGIRGAPV